MVNNDEELKDAIWQSILLEFEIQKKREEQDVLAQEIEDIYDRKEKLEYDVSLYVAKVNGGL